MYSLTHPVKGIPWNDIVLNHTADEAYSQLRFIYYFHDTGMYSIPVAFYRPMLAIKAQRSVTVRCGLEGKMLNGGFMADRFLMYSPSPFRKGPAVLQEMDPL